MLAAAVSELYSQAKVTVEKAIEGFGVKADAVRVAQDDTQTAWSLMRGSALTLISVVVREDGVFMRVVCPVMTLPTEADKKAALFQHLLELNASAVVGTSAFGLATDRVVVVSERPAKGLDQEEAAFSIKRASAVADTFDDRLVKEFGGKRASDAQSA